MLNVTNHLTVRTVPDPTRISQIIPLLLLVTFVPASGQSTEFEGTTADVVAWNFSGSVLSRPRDS